MYVYINPSTSLHMPHRKRQTNSISGVCALFYHSTASQFPTNSPHSTPLFTGLNKKSIRVNCIFICIEFSLPVRVLLFAFGFHTCPHSRQANLNMGSAWAWTWTWAWARAWGTGPCLVLLWQFFGKMPDGQGQQCHCHWHCHCHCHWQCQSRTGYGVQTPSPDHRGMRAENLARSTCHGGK